MVAGRAGYTGEDRAIRRVSGPSLCRTESSLQPSSGELNHSGLVALLDKKIDSPGEVVTWAAISIEMSAGAGKVSKAIPVLGKS